LTIASQTDPKDASIKQEYKDAIEVREQKTKRSWGIVGKRFEYFEPDFFPRRF